MDKRTQRTRGLLNRCFTELLLNKTMDHITVTLICQMADVNRSTYYYYFTDPFDQLKKLRDDFFHGMCVCMTFDEFPITYDMALNSVCTLCDYYLKNRTVYFAISSATSYDLYTHELFMAVRDTIINNLRLQNVRTDKNVMNDLVVYMLSGCDRLLGAWLKNSPSEFQPTEMASLLMQLCYHGISAFIIE